MRPTGRQLNLVSARIATASNIMKAVREEHRSTTMKKIQSGMKISYKKPLSSLYKGYMKSFPANKAFGNSWS